MKLENHKHDFCVIVLLLLNEMKENQLTDSSVKFSALTSPSILREPFSLRNF
jgi:hypothetical protein